VESRAAARAIRPRGRGGERAPSLRLAGLASSPPRTVDDSDRRPSGASFRPGAGFRVSFGHAAETCPTVAARPSRHRRRRLHDANGPTQSANYRRDRGKGRDETYPRFRRGPGGLAERSQLPAYAPIRRPGGPSSCRPGSHISLSTRPTPLENIDSSRTVRTTVRQCQVQRAQTDADHGRAFPSCSPGRRGPPIARSTPA
jgi:hypothetical protein